MNLLIPSLKITGGNIEAIKLVDEVASARDGSNVKRNIYVLWHSAKGIEVSRNRIIFLSSWCAKRMLVPLQIPFLLIKFYFINRNCVKNWIFTHYSTLPFSFFIPRNRRYFFVQDLEWKFIENKILKYVIKRFILITYSRGKILVANNYLQDSILQFGLNIYGNIDIWADVNFLASRLERSDRTIDGVMVLRNGGYKRLDLYREFISKCSLNMNLTLAVITPEKKIFDEFEGAVKYCYFSPSQGEMKEIYSKSKIFIHLSDHEGFGLPPLEAMGEGCVPLCRDSGGVKAYMKMFEADGLLLPSSLDVDQIINIYQNLLKNIDNLERLSKTAIQIFSLGLKRDKLKIFLHKINDLI